MKFKTAVGALVCSILLVGSAFGAGDRYVYGISIGTPLEEVAQIGVKGQIWYMFLTSAMLIVFFGLACWMDLISNSIKKWLGDRIRAGETDHASEA